jgi:RNA-binding protein Musashi
MDVKEPELARKLFVTALSRQTTCQTLKDFYGKFGTVVDCLIVTDKETNQSRGYGFVTMSSKSEVSYFLIYLRLFYLG